MPALLDTCVVIDFPKLKDQLSGDLGLPAVVLAELFVGFLTVPPGPERTQREQRLQWAQEFFEPYPFDADAALSYGGMVSALRRAGRSPKSRVADLMIAATAAASGLALYTSNADDFRGLEDLLEIRVIS